MVGVFSFIRIRYIPLLQIIYMKQRTMLIISGVVSAVGLYFLLKPKLKSQTTGSATQYKTITDNGFIITIPDSGSKKFDVVYIFGGMAYATPKWMFSQTPNSILLKNVVIFAPYTSKYSATKSKLSEIINPKGIKTDSVSMLGFSAGALNVLYNFSKNLKFVGLIDPSNKEELLDLDFGKNTYMVYNQSNWGAYPRIKKDMGTMADNIQKKGGTAENVKISHKEIPAYFLKRFASAINK
jgi:hypothetical protein